MHGDALDVLILVGLFVCSGLGVCPVQPQFRVGQVSYNDWPKKDECEWIIPPHPREDFALVLSLRSLAMQNSQRYCSGYLGLPELNMFCNKPRGSCFIYGLKSKCSMDKIASILNKTSCSETYLFMLNKIRRRVSLYPKENVWKSFTLDYKYVRCSQDVEEKTPQTSLPPQPYLTTASNVSDSSLRNTGEVLLKGRSHTENDESFDSTESGNALVAVTVILAVLLILSLLIILWSHRRNRKLEARYEMQSRIRYSLSNPVRDRKSTMTANREVEQTTYNEPCNNQVTPLHGEVIQNTIGDYSEIGASQKHSNEMLSNRVVIANPPPQDCVYAVVNKSMKRK